METDDFGGCGLGLRQLRYVRALVERRSFRGAGAALALAPGVLAHEVARAERALGAGLSGRAGGAVVATADAADLAEAARRAIAADAASTRDADGPEPVLRVGVLDFGRGQAVHRAAVAEFQARYPHIAVQLSPLPLARQPHAVAGGTLDAGFVAGPAPALAGLSAHVLFADSIGCALIPAGHRLADADELSMDSFRGVPMQIMRAEDAPEVVAGMHDAIARSGWRGRQLPGLARASEVLTAVACGAGWAPTASSLLGWAPAGVVVRPLADGPLVPYDIHLVWRDGDPRAAAFARLVLELRDVIRPLAAPRRRGPAPAPRYGARATPRSAERARIARDLHDTVLQDLIGSEMELDALRRRLPPALADERATLERVVAQLARAGRAGRDAVRGLRAARPSPRDLALVLSSVAEELREASPREFRMRTDGTPRELRPRAEEAAYRIGVEALTNAFRHAAAALVSVSLDYSADQFRLVVADDGRGIAPEVLHAGGRAGHFGLAGMRERAAEAGGALGVRSGPGAGSTVELLVPGHAAFAGVGR